MHIFLVILKNVNKLGGLGKFSVVFRNNIVFGWLSYIGVALVNVQIQHILIEKMD